MLALDLCGQGADRVLNKPVAAAAMGSVISELVALSSIDGGATARKSAAVQPITA
jgi:hypothetical protein